MVFSRGRFVLFASLLLVGAGGVTGCHRDPSPRIRLKAIERCEDGVTTALAQRNLGHARRIYHRECSGLFFEPNCAKAFEHAGHMSAESGDQETLAACQKDYCAQRLLTEPEACRTGFVATPAATPHVLGALESAIITYDARGYASRAEVARFKFLVGIVERFGPQALPKPEPAVTDAKAP